MSQINREALEKRGSLSEARSLVELVYYDSATYSSEDIRRRTGVFKVLAEEYFPLLWLAEALPGARSIRLLPKGNPGPDGEIQFWYSPTSKVQIVCANESYNWSLMREELAAGRIVSPNQRFERVKKPRGVKTTGSFLSAADDRDLQERMQRITAAIEKKEQNYYRGTDTLLVSEEPSNFKHLKDLHQRLCENVRKSGPSRYERIYVSYQEEVKRVS